MVDENLRKLERLAKAGDENAIRNYSRVYERVHGPGSFKDLMDRLTEEKNRQREREQIQRKAAERRLIREIADEIDVIGREYQEFVASRQDPVYEDPEQGFLFGPVGIETEDFIRRVIEALQPLFEDGKIDWYPGRADDQKSNVVVISGDWNVEREFVRGQGYVGAADNSMQLLGNALEVFREIELAWNDMTTSCDDCNRAIIEDNHFSPIEVVGESFRQCIHCFRESPSDYLEFLTSHPRERLPQSLADTLEPAGYYKLSDVINDNIRALLRNLRVDFLLTTENQVYSRNYDLMQFINDSARDARYEIPTGLAETATQDEDEDEEARIAVYIIQKMIENPNLTSEWPNNIETLVDEFFDEDEDEDEE